MTVNVSPWCEEANCPHKATHVIIEHNAAFRLCQHHAIEAVGIQAATGRRVREFTRICFELNVRPDTRRGAGR